MFFYKTEKDGVVESLQTSSALVEDGVAIRITEEEYNSILVSIKENEDNE